MSHFRLWARLVRNYIVQFYINIRYSPLVSKVPYHYQKETIKKIWIVWWQGTRNMPYVVRNCYQSVIRNNPDYEVIVVDKDNYCLYADIPYHIMKAFEEGRISFIHLSDILRFALLYKNGGWYLTATVFLTASLPIVDDLYTVRLSMYPINVNSMAWCGFLWYMPPKHPLSQFMNLVYDTYWKSHHRVITYLLLDHFIRLYWDKQLCFRKQLLLLGTNNKNMYFFRTESAYDSYNQEKWSQILLSTFAFKLNINSRPIPPRDQIKDGTYLAWFIDNYFDNAND